MNQTISENTIKNCVGNGIHLYKSSYATVTLNKVYNADYGIRVWGVDSVSTDNNNIQLNTIRNSNYGIEVKSTGVGNADNNRIANNVIGGCTTPFKISGATNTQLYRNTGYVTENSGLGTLYNLTSSITVAHGLDYTPTADEFSITFTSSLANCTQWWISGIGAANFDLNVGDAGAAKFTSTNIEFGWPVNRQ